MRNGCAGMLITPATISSSALSVRCSTSHYGTFSLIAMLKLSDIRIWFKRRKPDVPHDSLELSPAVHQNQLCQLTDDLLWSIASHFTDLNEYVSLSQTCSRLRMLLERDPEFWRRACMAAGFGIPRSSVGIASWRMLACVVCMHLNAVKSPNSKTSPCHWQ